MAIIPGLNYLCTLGKGSTGTVSLASDPISARLVAVKSAEVSLSSPLQHEHRILSSLSSPYVVSCYGTYITNSHFHLMLEFAPGGSLFDRIKNHTEGRLDECHIRLYVRDILLGLSYLHTNHISHGDIKSQNVLIGSDGRAKLADFGAAAILTSGTHSDNSGSFSGTPAFMAPEIARGEEWGPAADTWALGCTIIEMATGKAPWNGIIKDSDVMAAIYRIGYCSGSVPDIPDWLSKDAQDFLTNCLIRDPNERWLAEQLLCHPFVCFGDAGLKRDGNLDRAISPYSVLDFNDVFCESETEEEEVDSGLDPLVRIRELAGSISGSDCLISDSDDEDCWIEVRNENGGENRDSEISDEFDLFEFYEEDSYLMLFNFGYIFEIINEEMRVSCGNVTSEFNVCKVSLTNKSINPFIDQNIYCSPFCFCLVSFQFPFIHFG
ncbi:mitogen-activated protein kinase kinase kinase 18-like [Carex rostrata]